MNYFVLMVMPHLNVRASIRALRREARDFAADDAVMALPEGFILCWFEALEFGSSKLDVEPKKLRMISERMQLALAKSESDICDALPEPCRFLSIEKVSDLRWLILDREIDTEKLLHSLQAFTSSLRLEIRAAPHLYAIPPLGGIALGSAGGLTLSTPISFKKYELVIYLAELPDTPLSGFQFRAIARVHHKKANKQRRSHIE